MHKMPSVLTAIGLVLILVGGLHGETATDGAVAFMAFLILAVTTYPPADPRRGYQAAMVLAGAIGLLGLALLFDEVRMGTVAAEVIDDLLMLIGSGMVMANAAGRLLGDREDRAATGWSGGPGRAQPAPPIRQG